jgi:DNA (cytosine-5)-methyltransferase 1
VRWPPNTYDHLRGQKTAEEIYACYPEQGEQADSEAWNAELGNNETFPTSQIDRRISRSLNGAKNWLPIGGPPCQAYSTGGRSRVIPVDRHEGTQNYEKDKRHFLYRAYLRSGNSASLHVFEEPPSSVSPVELISTNR